MSDLTFTCRSHTPPLHSEALPDRNERDAENVWKHRAALAEMARDDMDVWNMDLPGAIVSWVIIHRYCDVVVTDEAGGVYELPDAILRYPTTDGMGGSR